MKAPEWWPRGWPWPGGTPRESGPAPASGPRRVAAASSRSADPPASFLRLLVSAFGAERAVVYRRARDGASWIPERRSPREASALRSLEARGHPLTWCARERLIAQIPTAELPDGPVEASWLLAGGLPGGDRVLVMAFAGAPPTAARRAMEAAVEHLASLALDRPGEGRTNWPSGG